MTIIYTMQWLLIAYSVYRYATANKDIDQLTWLIMAWGAMLMSTIMIGN